MISSFDLLSGPFARPLLATGLCSSSHLSSPSCPPCPASLCFSPSRRSCAGVRKPAQFRGPREATLSGAQLSQTLLDLHRCKHADSGHPYAQATWSESLLGHKVHVISYNCCNCQFSKRFPRHAPTSSNPTKLQEDRQKSSQSRGHQGKQRLGDSFFLLTASWHTHRPFPGFDTSPMHTLSLLLFLWAWGNATLHQCQLLSLPLSPPTPSRVAF